RPLDLQLEEGRSITVQIRRRTSARSPHTGRELQELHGWVSTTDDEIHRWLSIALRAIGDNSVRSFDGDEPAGRWRLSWNSYGESEGIHSYGLILKEAEELSLEMLVVDSMELHPYEYREQFFDEGLTIVAKMVGTHADVTRLNRVIRTRAS